MQTKNQRNSVFTLVIFRLLLYFVFVRSGIKKVVQLLIQLRSLDKARLVATEHNMDELLKDT